MVMVIDVDDLDSEPLAAWYSHETRRYSADAGSRSGGGAGAAAPFSSPSPPPLPESLESICTIASTRPSL